MSDSLGFIEQILPPVPSDEIQRDALVRQIAARFGPECQQQLVVGRPLTGKTTLLAQFVREKRGQCVAYFVTRSAFSQQQFDFLYSLCSQMSNILQTGAPPDRINLEDLKQMYLAQCFKLRAKAAGSRPYYFVIDGLDWAAEGEEGSRIIDLLPKTAPRGPYLLASCLLEKQESLSRHGRWGHVEPGEFDSAITEAFLQDCGFTPDQMQVIHRKYHGVPGHLRILKEAKRADPAFDPETAPVELGRLISEQVHRALAGSSPDLVRALQLLAASPAPLPCGILAELVGIEEQDLAESLERSGLVSRDPGGRRVEYSSDLVRDAMRARRGAQTQADAKELLEHVKRTHGDQDLLLDLLFEEVQDYQGLCTSLANPAIVDAIDRTADASGIMRRMRSGLRMAQERHKTDDLFERTLGITALKGLIRHATSSSEIEALLATGRSEKAISRAYAIPETTVRIRLLARAYASMSRHGERVAKSALDELEAMVEEVSMEGLDKEIVQEAAIDLFPVLPDAAFRLLERVIGSSDRRSVVEVAIQAIEAVAPAQKDGLAGVQRDLGYATRMLSGWLNGLPLSELKGQLASVQSTAAQEYIIRQWCRQNSKADDTGEAVDLWLDTVIADSSHVILLRSLRHMAAVVCHVRLDDRRRLLERLRWPQFASLDSPMEEWVGFHLNMAQATFALDPELALEEARRVHTHIVNSSVDLDVRVSCLARLWATVRRLAPEDADWASAVDRAFEDSLDRLLADSAEQLEPLVSSFRVLAELEPTDALISAMRLNTCSRRTTAVQIVLATALRKLGDTNLEDILDEGLKQLGEPEKESTVTEVTSQLAAMEAAVAPENLQILLDHARRIGDPSLRAQALISLSNLYKPSNADEALGIVDESIAAWRLEDDLKVRLSMGYYLVQRVAKLDLARADQLFDEVLALKHQPGTPLAIGYLGATFREMLELAIRAITFRDMPEPGEGIAELEGLIAEIPAPKVRIDLLSKLAARAYSLGNSGYAERIAKEVMRQIDELPHGPEQVGYQLDWCEAARNSLPVIAGYDFATAEQISEELPYPLRDEAWHSVVFWSLCRSHLGDHYFNPRELKIPSDYQTLKGSLASAQHVCCDVLLSASIEAIANAVRVSFGNGLDLHQALDILNQLDALATEKLPEPKKQNITHEGFRVFAEASVHGARCSIFQKLPPASRRGLTFKQMAADWAGLRARAEAIPNLADRVLVIAHVAREMVHLYGKDRQISESFLKKAEARILDLPTLVDRAARLQAIAESWQALGVKSQAEVMLDKAMEVASTLEGTASDDRLRHIVQAAYEVDPSFADELASRLDTRSSLPFAHPAQVAVSAEQLRSNPSGIEHAEPASETRGKAMAAAATRLLHDFATGRGHADRTAVAKWLMLASSQKPSVSLEVAHWGIETLHRVAQHGEASCNVDVFLRAAVLARDLANWVATARGEGLPETVHDSFPGLGTKFVDFQAGQADRARHWLLGWLSQNARNRLKICDPYFGVEDIEYLTAVPLDCRIVVVTSDKGLDVKRGPDEVTLDLKRYWHSCTSRTLPRLQLLIVPDAYHDRFHDRAMITEGAGLSLGPSLGGLGKSRQVITILPAEEAAELETVYVDKMLSGATWFMDGVMPTVIVLGE